MAYEIYLLPLPRGADAEAEGEALLARIDRMVETPVAPAALPDLGGVERSLREVDAALAPARVAAGGAPGRGLPVVVLAGSDGVEVTLARAFVRLRVPFDHAGAAATAVFDRVFRLLDAAARATGWAAYDPQEAEAVRLDASGREAALLIYQTAMDQVRGGSAPDPSPRSR